MKHLSWRRLLIVTTVEKLWLDAGLRLALLLDEEGMQYMKLDATVFGDAVVEQIRRSGFRY
jgi:hypothetical protein